MNNSQINKIKKYFENQHVPIAIETTNICSAKCTFCWYGKGSDWRSPGYINERVLDRTLELLSDHAKHKEKVSLSTSHGDILTYKDIIKTINRITSIKNVLGVNFFTNAILFNKFNMRELLNKKILNMNISVAIGSEEQYARLFGVNAYSQVMSNIIEVLKINKEKKDKRIAINLLLRVDKPFEIIKKSSDYQLLEELIGKNNIKFKDTWDDFNGIVKQGDLPRGKHTFKKAVINPNNPCYALFRKLKILKDGEIVICNCRLSREFIVGNVFDDKKLEEVWHSDRLRKLRENWFLGKLPKICYNCSHYQPVSRTYKRIKKNRNILYNYLNINKNQIS